MFQQCYAQSRTGRAGIHRRHFVHWHLVLLALGMPIRPVWLKLAFSDSSHTWLQEICSAVLSETLSRCFLPMRTDFVWHGLEREGGSRWVRICEMALKKAQLLRWRLTTNKWAEHEIHMIHSAQISPRTTKTCIWNENGALNTGVVASKLESQQQCTKMDHQTERMQRLATYCHKYNFNSTI